MKKNTITIFFCLFAILNIVAADYEPLVRKDRVWEYFHYIVPYYFQDMPKKEFRQMQFTDSIEYNGKIYWKFTETKIIKELDNNEYKDSLVNNVRAYMREENKIVYTLVDQQLMPLESIADSTNANEVVLYVCDNYHFLTDENNRKFYGLHVNEFCPDIKIITGLQNPFECGGKQYNCYQIMASSKFLGEEGYQTNILMFVEGLGIVQRHGTSGSRLSAKYEIGFLFLPTYSPQFRYDSSRSTPIYCKDSKYIGNFLNRILDNDGKILYEGENIKSEIKSISYDNLSTEIDRQYYTIDGIKTVQPRKNQIYIEKTIFSDGTIKTRKVVF